MSQISRRAFLATAAAGAAGAFLGVRPAGAAPMDPTEAVSLGALRVPLFGMGTGMHGGKKESDLIRAGLRTFDRCIGHAYDEGVRLFDLADMYGSHIHTARALRGKPRDSYVLVSKLWFRGADALGGDPVQDADVAVERFLKECDTDYLDLVQIHCMTKPDWTTAMRKQMDLLDKCKEKGLIKAHGVSCHSLNALKAAAKDPWIDVVHARINPYGTAMDGPPEEVIPVLRDIHAAGKGVIGMKIIGEGRFSNDPDKIDKSIRHALDLDCVDAMVVGFLKTSEIDDFKMRVRRALEAKLAEQPRKAA